MTASARRARVIAHRLKRLKAAVAREAMRQEMARNCVTRNLGDCREVLEALGLSPTVYTCEPFTSDRGHQASTRNRDRKRKEARAT